MNCYRWCSQYDCLCPGPQTEACNICIAHSFNLVVKKALEQTPGLNDIRTKTRKLVGYFRSSTTAKVYGI